MTLINGAKNSGFFKVSRRFLNLQEFQSKELMNKFGLKTQKFKIIQNASEAEKAIKDLSNVFLRKPVFIIHSPLLFGSFRSS